MSVITLADLLARLKDILEGILDTSKLKEFDDKIMESIVEHQTPEGLLKNPHDQTVLKLSIKSAFSEMIRKYPILMCCKTFEELFDLLIAQASTSEANRTTVANKDLNHANACVQPRKCISENEAGTSAQNHKTEQPLVARPKQQQQLPSSFVVPTISIRNDVIIDIHRYIDDKGPFWNFGSHTYNVDGKAEFWKSLAKNVPLTKCRDVLKNIHSKRPCHPSGLYPHIPVKLVQDADILEMARLNIYHAGVIELDVSMAKGPTINQALYDAVDNTRKRPNMDMELEYPIKSPKVYKLGEHMSNK